jgi:drug/metabolite transporter (DMT)-like permease
VTERRHTAERVGVLLAACGAVSYGFTVVIGRDLAGAGFGPATALGVRFSVGGLLLALIVRIRGIRLLPSRRQVGVGLLLGVVYAIEASLFYSALERMSAGATSLVFYVYPVIVTMLEWFRGRDRPHRATLVALTLSTVGTAVVVAAGSEVSVTAGGVAFALCAAVSFAVYLVTGRNLGGKTDPMVMACWVAIGAGLSNLTKGAIAGELTDVSSRSLEIVVYGATTALAFTMMFAALPRVGASRVAVVMTLEAVASVVLAAIFLDERLTFVQVLGGAAVLAAAVVIALAQADVATAEASAPGAGP